MPLTTTRPRPFRPLSAHKGILDPGLRACRCTASLTDISRAPSATQIRLLKPPGRHPPSPDPRRALLLGPLSLRRDKPGHFLRTTSRVLDLMERNITIRVAVVLPTPSQAVSSRPSPACLLAKDVSTKQATIPIVSLVRRANSLRSTTILCSRDTAASNIPKKDGHTRARSLTVERPNLGRATNSRSARGGQK